MESIWTEKYRPKTFNEVIGQNNIVKRVEAMTKTGNLPNLLFSGPPGIGKSTLALVIANELFQNQSQSNFLELNASDERGIDVVRNTIKDFARMKSISGTFKIIFLDECDSLTKEAQQALRRTMENFSRNTRFILSANYSSKIIEPIQSRCISFKFRPLEKEQMKEIIDNIEKKENLTIDEKAKQALIEISEGDARKIANILQSCAAFGNQINEEMVFNLVSAAKQEEILDIINTAIAGNFLQSKDKLFETMLKHSLSGTDIIKQIQKGIWKTNLPDETKIKLIDKCGEIEFRLVEGSDEFIQLEALLAQFTGKCF